jgi:hypothetical protein
MTIREEYDAVNSMLTLLGESAIPMPDLGTDREKLQHLLDAYLAILMSKAPKYADIPDPRLIPDMILVHLFESMDRMK